MDFRSGPSERLVKSRMFKTSCENIRCVSLAHKLIVPISIENIQMVSPHHCLILIRDIISAFFPEKQLIWCSIQELGRRQWSRSKVRSFFLRLLHRWTRIFQHYMEEHRLRRRSIPRKCSASTLLLFLKLFFYRSTWHKSTLSIIDFLLLDWSVTLAIGIQAWAISCQYYTFLSPRFYVDRSKTQLYKQQQHPYSRLHVREFFRRYKRVSSIH